jgi:ribosome biogenesis GTPase
VIAANVDTVFVVTSLNRDFSPRRLERYLAFAWEGGARPVVVLSKADLCEDPAASVEETESVSAGVPVVAVSALSGDIAALEPFLAPRTTVALVGSSGVGKSTLANRLLGEERMAVQQIRTSDDTGRHTTRHRAARCSWTPPGCASSGSWRRRTASVPRSATSRSLRAAAASATARTGASLAAG